MGQDSKAIRHSINIKPRTGGDLSDTGDIGVDAADSNRLVYNDGSGPQRVLLQIDADSGAFTDAANVSYDNTASGLTATDVQEAIDEIEAAVVTTVGTLDSETPSANGAVINGNDIVLQAATATAPGLVNTGTQTLGGNKELVGTLTVTNPAPYFYGQIHGDNSNGLLVGATSENCGFFGTDNLAQLYAWQGGGDYATIETENYSNPAGVAKMTTTKPGGVVTLNSYNATGVVRINHNGSSNEASPTILGGASITAKNNLAMDTNDITGVDELTGRRANLTAVNTNEVNLTLKRAAGQAVNILSVQNDVGAEIAHINQNGTMQVFNMYALTTTGGTLLGTDGAIVTVNSGDTSNQFKVYSGDTTRRVLNISSRAGQTANIIEVNVDNVTYGGDLLVMTPAGDVGIGDTTPDSKLTVNGRIESQVDGVRLKQSGSNYIGLKAPSGLAVNYDITLPSAAPASSTALVYDGVNYVWDTVSGGYASSIQTTLAASGTATIDVNKRQQAIEVSGNGAAVTLSSTPFGATPPPDKSVITLIGRSDSNTVTITNNDAADGCLLNGNATIGYGDVIELMYISSIDRYVERFRSF
jgi:hypothetical protein